MLILGIGVLLSGSLLAQTSISRSDWQSLKILQTADPIFPSHLLQVGVGDGEARVVINTDASGKLVDWLVVGYSHREFADAAVVAIKQWRFEPARLRGEPVGTTVELSFYFEAKGVVVSTTSADILEGQLMRIMKGSYAYQPCSLRELDRIPTPIVTITPQYSSALAQKGVKGKVTVEFFIDETGAVRLPAGSAKDDTLLTALAIDALHQWKFAPPTSKGRGVLVKASQEFDFVNGS
jgi:outer membrane biosynthesis protein TonB